MAAERACTVHLACFTKCVLPVSLCTLSPRIPTCRLLPQMHKPNSYLRTFVLTVSFLWTVIPQRVSWLGFQDHVSAYMLILCLLSSNLQQLSAPSSYLAFILLAFLPGSLTRTQVPLKAETLPASLTSTGTHSGPWAVDIYWMDDLWIVVSGGARSWAQDVRAQSPHLVLSIRLPWGCREPLAASFTPSLHTLLHWEAPLQSYHYEKMALILPPSLPQQSRPLSPTFKTCLKRVALSTAFTVATLIIYWRWLYVSAFPHCSVLCLMPWK
jgi:hypothetical protein